MTILISLNVNWFFSKEKNLISISFNLFAEKEHPLEANVDPEFSLVPDQSRIRILSQTPGEINPAADGILLDSSPETPETSNQSQQNYYKWFLSS